MTQWSLWPIGGLGDTSRINWSLSHKTRSSVLVSPCGKGDKLSKTKGDNPIYNSFACMLICKTFAHDHRMKNIDILRMQIASSCWHALYLWPQIKSIKRPNFSEWPYRSSACVYLTGRHPPWESLQFGGDENKVRILSSLYCVALFSHGHTNKKLRYRRGTARHAVFVETTRNVAQASVG